MYVRILNVSKSRDIGYDHEINVVSAAVDLHTFNVRKDHVQRIIKLYDVMRFTDGIKLYKNYDAALELHSFHITSHRNLHCLPSQTFLGIFWKKIPEKYISKYKAFREQACIEVKNDIILVSPMHNSLFQNMQNAETVAILWQEYLRLRCIWG